MENGYKDGGNYWSDWIGPDVNMDGVVDQPRGRDFFPVTVPNGWTNIVPERNIRNLNSGLDYYSFANAIKEAANGDLIEASGGEITGRGKYYENVQITIPLTLRSSGTATITAASLSTPTVEIRSNDVSINGFILTGSPVAGVKSDGYSNCVISNNTIKANSYGIMIYRGSNFRIENNIIRDNNSVGIFVFGTRNNTIKGNEVSMNGTGINIYAWSSDNIVTDNNIIRNWTGVYIDQNIYSGMIYHNNLIENNLQVYSASGNSIQLDNGYPDGGNHYSNWISPDEFSGPEQNITGADGIVDSPYGNDRYPFVKANGWIPQNTPPIANAGSDLKVLIGEKFTLDATSSFDAEGPIAIYSWRFGDGNIYTEDQASFPDGAFDGKTTYTYNQVGAFTVALTVTDSAGATSTDAAVVTVMSLSQGLDLIADMIMGIYLPKGPENALLAKVIAAKEALSNGDTSTAKQSLQDMIDQISAPGFAKNG